MIPLQTPWVRQWLDVPVGEPLSDMKVLTIDGSTIGGADAALYLSRTIWWAWPLWLVGHIRIVRHVLRRGYAWVAQRWPCAKGACQRPAATRPAWIGWIPLGVLPALAIAARAALPAWAFMWTLAYALYAGFKWLTWWQACATGLRPDWLRSAGYLLLWPGMDARSFLNDSPRHAKPTTASWMSALSTTAVGAVLMWAVVRCVPEHDPLLRGWIGMLGLILLLHFGSFHLMALLWQTAGVDAQPIMQAPLLATSLSDFWGNRWNLGFRHLSHALVFQPLRSRAGAAAASLAVFLASGLMHEAVISLPAGAGYGLPTAYFLLQGIGVLLEHSEFGQRWGLSSGLRGRLFTILFTAAPAYWLFHPPFVTRVVVPFLHALKAC